MTPQSVLGFVKAEPFRPFRIHTAGGRTFDVRHPRAIKVLKDYVMLFRSETDDFEIFDRFESVPLTLADFISPIDNSVR